MPCRHASATEVALAIISVNECKLADMMTIDEKQLRAIITGKTEVSPPELAKELLAARVKLASWNVNWRRRFAYLSPVRARYAKLKRDMLRASAIAVRQFVKPVFLLRG